MLTLTQREQRWFVVPFDPTGDTKILVRQLLDGDRIEIQEGSEKVVTALNRGADGSIKSESMEIQHHVHERRALTFTSAVVDWVGFTDPAGEKIPCTETAKREFLKAYPELATFVDDCLKALDGDEAEVPKEDKVKN